MNNLLLLIKAVSAALYSHALKDRDTLNELVLIAGEIPKSKNSLVEADRAAESLLRNLLKWIAEQPLTDPIIESVLNIKIAEVLLTAPELTSAFEYIFKDVSAEEKRRIIFENTKDIRKEINNDKVNFKLKNLLKPIIFNGEQDLSKSDWLKLADILTEKINSYGVEIDKAVIEEASSENRDPMVDIIDQLKIDLSPEGILKCGLKGINESLYPDMGFRRKMFYLILALTNRGKSFFLAHLLASFVLYNKPLSRDSTKRPTIFFCSAEDSMGLILTRMFEIFMTAKTGIRQSFRDYSSDEIIDYIMKTFEENGWTFAFYRVDPAHEDIRELKQRVRNLEIRGHEIVVGAYDYLAMMKLDGCHGDTRTDKIQDLFRQTRNFFIARNAMFLTPHQLNPKAKDILRENDDESEVRFVKEVGGHSMTEGSTKITNEVDYEITIHIAKLLNGTSWFCWYLGKQRGDEGAEINARGGLYELEKTKGDVKGRGLVHDIYDDKPGYRRQLYTNEMLESEFE